MTVREGRRYPLAAVSALSATLAVVVLAAGCGDDGAADRDAGGPDASDDLGGGDVLDGSGDGDLGADGSDASPDGAPSGPVVSMDFTHAAGFYAAPFPDDSRLVDGRTSVGDFPNPEGIAFVDRVVGLVDGEADGFGVSAGVFFALSAPVELPALELTETVGASSPVALVSVDRDAPDFGRRYPVYVTFEADGGPFGAANLLALVPVQGFVLRERTTYAAYVRRDLPAGEPLAVPEALAQLRDGVRPEGLSDAAFATYDDALSALDDLGVALDDLAGLTVFTTWSPTEELLAVRDQLLEAPLPELDAPLALDEVFDDFCVYESTLPMPTYQAGEPPYAASGGGWVFAEDGTAVLQGTEQARIVATVPRSTAPENGYPAVVFVRVGGGGDRPLVDRGVRGEPGGEALIPGTGPALTLAHAGYGGLSIDGPHGGLRNVTHGDEQLLTFNVTNPLALRDNIREGALETALAAHLAGVLTVDATDCPGVDAEVGFDPDHLALMGHSMGATVMMPAAAAEPAFRGLVLSGAGGSYIENVVYKLSPFPVRPVAENIVHYMGTGRHLERQDPILSLLQWAGEPSDPPVYGRLIVDEPRDGGPARHVLMLQGIVDTYQLPPMANAASLSMGLDLAGDAHDVGNPELAEFDPLSALLPLAGRARIALPASGNREVDGADVTAVVVQHEEDGIEDGHEIAYQLGAPKRQYRCFLQSLLTRTPVVPPNGEEDDPCP